MKTTLWLPWGMGSPSTSSKLRWPVRLAASELAEALAPAANQLKLSLEASQPGATDSGSWLLDLIGWEPITVDGIVASAGRPPIDVTLEIERQLAAGMIGRHGVRIERIRP